MGEDAATLPRCQTRHAAALSPRNSLAHERLAFSLDSSPANLPLPLPANLPPPLPPPLPPTLPPTPPLQYPAQSPSSPSTTTPLRGYIDAATVILLTTEVPNPPLPAADKDQQLGQKPHTLGRLLPGLLISAPLTATIPGARMDEQGFLTRI